MSCEESPVSVELKQSLTRTSRKKLNFSRTAAARKALKRRWKESNSEDDQEISDEEVSLSAEVVQDPDPQLPIQGRRIIYVKCLAKGLSACVDPECGKPLSLSDTEEERQYGLASVLFVRCRACQLLNKIHTDTHMERKEGQRGPTPYTSNVKAAAGE